jgi:tol-pal system protein YbgF
MRLFSSRVLVFLFSTVLFLIGRPETIQAQTQVEPQRLYDRVMEEFRHQDYEAALAGLRLFLELHGRSPLAPTAQYWAGECEFRLRRYPQALTSFYDVIARYPKNPKRVAAIFKIGLTYQRLGQHDESQRVLQRVVEQFPGSREAELARKHLNPPSDDHIPPVIE